MTYPAAPIPRDRTPRVHRRCRRSAAVLSRPGRRHRRVDWLTVVCLALLLVTALVYVALLRALE